MPKRYSISPSRRAALAEFVAERMRVLNLGRSVVLARSGVGDATLRNMLDGADSAFSPKTLAGLADALGLDPDGFARWARGETDVDPTSLLAAAAEPPAPTELAERIAALPADDRRRVEELIDRLSR